MTRTAGERIEGCLPGRGGGRLPGSARGGPGHGSMPSFPSRPPLIVQWSGLGSPGFRVPVSLPFSIYELRTRARYCVASPTCGARTGPGASRHYASAAPAFAGPVPGRDDPTGAARGPGRSWPQGQLRQSTCHLGRWRSGYVPIAALGAMPVARRIPESRAQKTETVDTQAGGRGQCRMWKSPRLSWDIADSGVQDVEKCRIPANEAFRRPLESSGTEWHRNCNTNGLDRSGCQARYVHRA